MKPRIKFGLIVGAFNFIMTLIVSFAVGLCGPLVGIIAGGVAGWLTLREIKPTTRDVGTREAAVAGVVAGALGAFGQVVGGLLALTMIQSSGVQLPFGQVPTGGDPAEMTLFYASGFSVGLCFGMAGVALSAGAGALVSLVMVPAGGSAANMVVDAPASDDDVPPAA